MKSNSRRGSAVLDAPEESFAPETAWTEREPAPAGTLHRGYDSAAGDEDSSTEADEQPYRMKRTATPRWRILLRSVGGRLIVLGCVVGALAFLLLFAAGARYYALHDERFILTTSADIQITGNQHVRRGQVLSVFGADLERNIFRMPLTERRADVERLPWVSHATVMRLLPNRIRVAITERTPIAFYRQGSQIGLVDGDGVLLDMPPDAAGDPHYSFPVLTGLSSEDTASTRAARMEIYRRFMGELDSTGQHLTQSISEVDVSNPEDIKALIASGGTDILVHFGDQEFLDRYRKFEAHLPEWKAQYPKLASADMRYESQIVLEMLPGTGVPLNTSSAASSPGSDDVTTPATAAALSRTTSAKTPLSAHHDGAAKPRTAVGPNARLFAELAAARKAAAARPKAGGPAKQ